MGSALRPEPITTPDDAEFETWKAKRAPQSTSAVQTPDDAEFEAWKATQSGAAGAGHGSAPARATGDVDFREPAPIQMAPVVVTADRPTAHGIPHAPAGAINDPAKPIGGASTPPTTAVSDATAVALGAKARYRPGVVERAGTQVGQFLKQAAEHPVATAAQVVTAPIKSALDAVVTPVVGEARHDPRLSKGGNSAGMTPAEIATPYDAEHGAITEKEQLAAAAQTLANIAFPNIESAVAERAAASGLGPIASNAAGMAAASAPAGAAYSPDDPLAGALAGGAIGGALGAAHAGIKNIRRVLPLPEPEPEVRALPAGPQRVESRVVEPEPAAPTEPDFTVEPTPDEAAFEAWKHEQAKTAPVAPEPAPASEGVAAPAASAQAEAPASSVTFRDLITMPRDEIRRLADEATTADKNIEAELFGVEGAKRYKALQARANSTIRSHAETNAASDEIATMEDALTPEQRNRLYGVGHEGLSADELREAARAVEPVDDTDTALLENTVAREMTSGQPHTNAASALRLREAMTELQRRTGRTPEDILNRAVITRRQMGGLSSAAQARELVAARMNDLRGAGFFADRTASSTERPSAPAALPPAEPVAGRLAAPTEAIPAGRVRDADGVVRYESARTTGAARRPVSKVSTSGLLDELLDLEQKRADAESRAPYELRDDENFHTSGIPQVVSTKTPGGGPSRQAKAFRNLSDFQRITDEIFDELGRRMPPDEIIDALEDHRAQRDERAGVAGSFAPGAIHRSPVRNEAGQVLFARAPGGGTAGRTAGGAARQGDAAAATGQGRDLFGNTPAPSAADQASLFGDAAGTEASRSLAETERAARAELTQLRAALPRTRPDARAPIAARIAELEKLVNRDKSITADELRVRAAAARAAAGAGDDEVSSATAGDAQPESPAAEEPTLFARAGSTSPRPRATRRRGASPDAPIEPADQPSTTGAEPPPKVAAGRLGRFADDIKSDLAPHTRSEEAGRMARITNAHTGAQAQRLEQAHEALRSFAKSFDRMQEPARLDFIDRMEHGLPQATPALTKAAALIRSLLDTARDEIRALGTGKLEQWLEDYFPHIWKDPDAAAPIIGRILGKRPLEGPKSFLKQRLIPTTKEGIEAGLVPVTTNPVDLTLLKLKEMRRYLAAHRILQEAEADGLLKYVPATQMGPEGWRRIEDRIGTVYGKPAVEASEAFDKQIREGLEAAIQRLTGLTHERRARTGMRGALGYAKGGDEMVTKFGSHDGVIMHELGHILDARYGLWRRLTGDVRTVSELQALARLRHESGDSLPSFSKYVQKPEEQIANALHALLHAPERMADVAPNTKRLLESFLASKPELKPLLDIKPSLELGTAKTEIPVAGLVVRGHYWAPEPVTNVLRNYLSPGLRGKAWYGIYGGLNNGLNQAQLGISAFHVGFTSLDAAVSQATVGLQHISHGRVLKGAGMIASYPVAPVTTMLRGHRLMKAYLNPETASPELVRIVKAIADVGGRARQDSFYETGQAKKFMQALRRASTAPLPKARELLTGTELDSAVGEAALRLIPAFFDVAAKPVMEFVVPRQKLGVFMQMAERALDDLPEDATIDDTRRALNRAWDSVDNRLGQLVYDRLFWNKTFKDLAMVSVRSVGWNLGTMRELGGGAIDLVKMANDARHGRRPELTERAGYVVMMPLIVGLTGAIMTYLLTGQGPQEIKDYFFPRTGRKNIEGNDERVQLPSYMKDVVAYGRHPVTTVEHKVAPGLSMLMDMLHNEDFYGDQIRNADDPFVTQTKQVVEYLLKGAIPFGVRNAQEAGKRVVDPRMKVAGFLGVTASPREETRTPAQNKMMEYLATKAPPGATPEKRDARTARSELMTAAREGTLTAGSLDAAEQTGALSDRQRRTIEQVQDGEGDIWLSRFNRLGPDEALRVYQLATPTEQAKYREALETKLIRAGREDDLDQLPPLHISSTSSTSSTRPTSAARP